MITRVEMIPVLLEVFPELKPEWEEFRSEWKGEGLPLYLFFGDVALKVIELHANGFTNRLDEIFRAVERWHTEGDSYVRNAATIGFLEDLQNSGLHKTTQPEDFRSYLLPESEKWWNKLNQFWECGEVSSDE
jgi:hypothetical protein